jgi:hypothetical protein
MLKYKDFIKNTGYEGILTLGEILCTIERDQYGRVKYVPGDGVGVEGSGPIGWLSETQITPHTKLFHFLVIGRYIPEDDDYEIFESIGKGTAIGRLSWYAGSKYMVFRINDANYMALGEMAIERASVFGRRHYDYALYVKLFAWALGYWKKELATGHWPPRPVRPEQIPYKTDRDFICIELYFAIWNLVGRRIRAHGHAPVPGEVIDAVNRGRLVVIDQHDGEEEAWRKPRKTITPPVWATLGKAAEHITRGDLVGLSEDGLVRIVKAGPPAEQEGRMAERFNEERAKILDKSIMGEPGILWDGGKLAELLCQVFGLSPDDVFRLTVDAQVGEAARITTYGYAKTTEGKLFKLKQYAINYTAKSKVSPPPKKFISGLDMIARPKGQKRNKIHIYRQPHGYPIRLCDWVYEEQEDIDIIFYGRGDTTLKNLLFSSGYLEQNQVCLHCWRVLLGERKSFGMENHGHGKGAPAP